MLIQPTQPALQSLTDIFAVSDINNLIHFDQLSFAGISNHDLLYISIDEPRIMDWNSCWYFSNVNDKLDAFKATASYRYDKYVPI